MKKIIFSATVVVLAFAMIGILYHKTVMPDRETMEKHDESLPNQNVTVDEISSEGDIIEISVDSVKGITQQEAEELCYSVLGEKDEDTGFAFSFGTSGAVEKDAEQYYVVRASWLVNHSHFSYIGDFFVSADGKKIYNGFAQHGEYEMSSVIWSE